MRKKYGGNSMVAPLRRVLLCPPESAGWCAVEQRVGWTELGYRHEPDAERAIAEHEELCAALEAAGSEVAFIPAGSSFTMDAVYTHDASLVTDFGAICLQMGKAARRAEPGQHKAYYEGEGTPILGEISSPGTAEAGDAIWLDDRTLLVGRGYRTNAEGIKQLRSLLSPKGVEVLSAPLPHASGPDSCLHLMSIMSMLDEHTALVDLPLLAVQTVELLSARGIRMVEIEYAERETLACNVLSLGAQKLIALVQNPRTNARLRSLGYVLQTFSGKEIGINGGGGPTCLTRPLLRHE